MLPPHTHTNKSLTHIDYYMDSVISVVQGGPDLQHRVFDCTVRALNWLFPSLMGDSKDSESIKNILSGEGDWIFVKEVLGWTLDTEAGMVILLEQKLRELLTLVDMLATQRRTGQKYLECLVCDT